MWLLPMASLRYLGGVCFFFVGYISGIIKLPILGEIKFLQTFFGDFFKRDFP